MKVPLIVGFLALLILLVGDGVMTNVTFARLQNDQRRITDLQAERLELEALLRLQDHPAKPVEAAVLLRKIAELLMLK